MKLLISTESTNNLTIKDVTTVDCEHPIVFRYTYLKVNLQESFMKTVIIPWSKINSIEIYE